MLNWEFSKYYLPKFPTYSDGKAYQLTVRDHSIQI